VDFQGKPGGGDEIEERQGGKKQTGESKSVPKLRAKKVLDRGRKMKAKGKKMSSGTSNTGFRRTVTLQEGERVD